MPEKALFRSGFAPFPSKGTAVAFTSGMVGMGKTALAAIAMVLSWGATAHAEILFIDANDQAVERRTMDDLARQYGERVIYVKGDGPELEEVFRRAEAGEIKLTTIVGSGHSSGTIFMGGGGSLSDSGIGEVLKKYPGAAQQVRHFIGLGCYTGTRYAASEWQARFPNATLLAGFNGIAPSGTWSARFLKQVFTATMDARRRAGGTDDALARRLGDNAASMRQLKDILSGLESVRITVASFQICEQFYDPKGRTREKIKEELAAGLRVFDQYFGAWGQEDVPANPHAPGPLRTFYNTLQEYLGVATGDERADLIKKKEQTIRLIYFGNVKKNFARSVSDADTAAANKVLETAGVEGRFPAPSSISTMTRRQLTSLVNELSWKVENLPAGPESDAAKTMLARYKNEIVDLQVPFSWIEEPR